MSALRTPHAPSVVGYRIVHFFRFLDLDPQPQDYELAKVYHPDATHGQHDVSPSMRNARFRAITHAYGVLRGRNGPSTTGGAGAWDNRDEAIRAELRRRSRRSRSSSTTAAADSVRHENTDNAQVWYSLMAFVLVGVSLPSLCILHLLTHDLEPSVLRSHTPPHPHPLAPT